MSLPKHTLEILDLNLMERKTAIDTKHPCITSPVEYTFDWKKPKNRLRWQKQKNTSFESTTVWNDIQKSP